MTDSWGLRFLGVGNACAVELGSAAAVLEYETAPILLIDCGQEALTAYLEQYGMLPDAVFITHAHFDHIAGCERLYYQTLFDPARCGKVRIYCAAALVPILQARLADYPSPLAEGGANFWDAFQLVPVGRGFWHHGYWFDVFPVRHHLPNTAFGLALVGAFLWSGDTRPITDQIAALDDGNMLIAHDCGLVSNPSHTGLQDLLAEYAPATRSRMIIYHYASQADVEQLMAAGLRVAKRGERFPLNAPLLALKSCARAWSSVVD